MLKNKVGRLAVIAAAIMTSLTVAAPANAASGGGCNSNPSLGSCISLVGQYLHADFYMNRTTPDSSMCSALMQIVKNGSVVAQKTYQLTYKGKYGPITNNIATLPPSSGKAFNRVYVYTCGGALHMTSISPTIYYP